MELKFVILLGTMILLLGSVILELSGKADIRTDFSIPLYAIFAFAITVSLRQDSLEKRLESLESKKGKKK